MNGLPRVTKDELLDAVKQGVREALVDSGGPVLWPSEVLNAIADGTREAIRESRQ